jgi:glutamine synthetase
MGALGSGEAAAAAPTAPAAAGLDRIAEAVESGSLSEIEVAWPDHLGHTLGKRLPAASFLERLPQQRVGFCDAALSWDVTATVHEGARLTDWRTGFPDLYAVPDPGAFRLLPWRPGTGQVVSDVADHQGDLVRTAPRTVLRGVTERLSRLGYRAEVGVETEFFLLDTAGQPLGGPVHCYSLEKLNDLDPVLTAIVGGLTGYLPVEAVTSEYGPGQIEINILHADPLTAADDAFRLKYAVRALARAAGARATFMAKPFQGLSGSSMHLHVSLWRDGSPAFAPRAGAENPLMRAAVAGLVRHLPAITVFGAPSINSYKRYEARSYAPATASWGGDNRTGAVRSLIEADHATRIELRTPGADANPYWAVASLLAAVVAGIEDAEEVAARGSGDLYGTGDPLPRIPAEAVDLARSDKRIVELLGEDAVHDYTLLVARDWHAYITAVTDWERDRYLDLA